MAGRDRARGKGGKKVSALATATAEASGPKRLRPLVTQLPADPDSEQKRPKWSFALIDHKFDGAWSWSDVGSHAGVLFPFLAEMEKLTWSEIRQQRVKASGGHSRPKHHGQEASTLCSDARDQLEELGLDDVDELFRFRLAGTERLWGIPVPNTNIFCLLWWDPNHQVYPVEK